MATFISLDNKGALNVVGSLAGTELLGITLDLYTRLGADVQLQVFFNSKKSKPSSLSDIVLRTKWVDTLTNDVILDISGTLSQSDDDTSSYVNIAESTEEFANVDVFTNTGWLDAVKLSNGFNAYNSLGRNKSIINLTTELPDVFDADKLYKVLTTQQVPPSYLVLPKLTELDVFNTALRAVQKINIPLKGEIDPSLTIDQAVTFATSLDSQDHRVELIWSPNKCRPRDAVSVYGKKSYCYAIGAYVGMLLLRNAQTSSQGIPMIADPVAGESYPFTYKAIEQRTDIDLDDDALEELAVAKINVVRPVNYDTGTKFVLSDILTQYQSENSALRLVSSSEIVTYTTNRVIDILRRHLLSRKDSYISKADKDISAFLSSCASSDVALLVAGDDLGGQPYQFELTPDTQKPFERVRLKLSRCPNGATRAVIFDDYVTK